MNNFNGHVVYAIVVITVAKCHDLCTSKLRLGSKMSTQGCTIKKLPTLFFIVYLQNLIVNIILNYVLREDLQLSVRLIMWLKNFIK